MLIEGRRGAGKTWVVLHTAGALVFGEPVFTLPTKPCRVLFLSQEMSEISIRARVMKMFTLPRMKAAADNLIVVCRDPNVTLSTDEGADYIAQMAREEKADVVMIDALRDVKGSSKENDNDEMGIVMVRLRDRIAGAANCAVVMIHHFGKPKEGGKDSGRGASVIEDVAADIVYIRDPKDGTFQREGVFEKTRDGSHQDQEFQFEITDDPETKTVQVEYHLAEGVSEDSEIAKAVDVVRRAGQLSAQDIFAALGWQRVGEKLGRTGQRRLARAVLLGLLQKARDGRRWIYRCPGGLIP